MLWYMQLDRRMTAVWTECKHLGSFIDFHASMKQKYSYNLGNSKELETLSQRTSIKSQISEYIPSTPISQEIIRMGFDLKVVWPEKDKYDTTFQGLSASLRIKSKSYKAQHNLNACSLFNPIFYFLHLPSLSAALASWLSLSCGNQSQIGTFAHEVSSTQDTLPLYHTPFKSSLNTHLLEKVKWYSPVMVEDSLAIPHKINHRITM